jgi:DNA-binding transcriptional MerR regulator
MEEKRYFISDAAREAKVEPHVLRYWEEELNLPIQRTELGHRYYTEEDIQTFQNIKELKERGFQLKAIKVLLPELKKRSGQMSEKIIQLETMAVKNISEEEISSATVHSKQEEKSEDVKEHPKNAVQKESVSENTEETSHVTMLPMTPNMDRLEQFEGIMTNLFRQTLKDNNEELENRISDAVLKGMDVLMQLREEKEEERFRRLDETIRIHQKKGKLVAAAREKKHFFLFRSRAGERT